MPRKMEPRGAATAAVHGEWSDTRSLVLNGDILLYGVIDPADDPFSGDKSIRAIDVMASLVELGDTNPVMVRINSPGGSVVEGFAIYNALRASGRTIHVHIDAMAASAASLVAMAGDEIVMAENASIMIHDPWAMVMGNAEDLHAAGDEIARQREIMVNIYAARTGREPDEIRAMMAAKTYMGAGDAVERGFADRADTPLKVAACALLSKDELARLLRLPASVRAQARSPAATAAQHRESTMAHEATHTGGGADQAAMAAAAQAHAAGATAAQARERPEAAPERRDAPAQDPAAVRAEAIKTERDRVQGITRAVRAAKLTPDFADELIHAGVSVQDAHARIINRWADGQEHAEGGGQAIEIRNHVRVETDGVERFVQGAQKGLLARVGLPGGERNEFTGLTLSELARASLNMRGVKNGHMDRMSMVGTAFTVRADAPGYHSQSDFGNIIQQVAWRAMMKGYEEIDETFPQWTAVGNASDFRPIARVDMGLFPALDQVPEGAEYKYGTIGDTGTVVQVATYGKMFAITRQAIVNDDLGFFDRVPRRMGRAAKRTIGNLVYAVLNGNPVMQDGVALFATAHGNLAATGAVPSVATIGAARAAMARQRDEQGIGTAVGVLPKFMLVPPELLDTATVALTSERIPGDPGQIINPVRNAAVPIADSRLTGTAWYLASDPNQVDTIEVTYLDGVQEPFMDQREGWNVDGSEFKVRIDAGVKALHWRGLFRNPGS